MGSEAADTRVPSDLAFRDSRRAARRWPPGSLPTGSGERAVELHAPLMRSDPASVELLHGGLPIRQSRKPMLTKAVGRVVTHQVVSTPSVPSAT